MPAFVPSSSARTASKPAASKQNGASHERRKTRVVRRRGRAMNALDSDDEIEREARTDSESEEDDDDLSSLEGSSSDSDTEPVSEDVLPSGHPHFLTQDTNQSPNEAAENAKVNGNAKNSFFTASGTWSEMVNDENENGPAELPVIDFAQLDSQSFPAITPSRKTKKPIKKSQRLAPVSSPVPAPPSGAPIAQDDVSEPLETPAQASASPRPISGRPFPRRPQGQSARQVYQQRLEEDPSYVPTVGDFWGHDDRLLDKELRSLSNWWRGRWQGRGRGRGFVRGRGAFSEFRRQEGQADGEETSQVPPVDRAWTHDGFEEMKKSEERKRTVQEQQQQSRQVHSPTNLRGGFLGARGRGGFTARGVRGGRGGFSPSFRGRAIGHGHPPGRVWFAMKPEFMWTKQHDSFLYNEPLSKSRLNQHTAIRVKLPGTGKEVIVKASLNASTPDSSSKSAPAPTPSPDVVTSSSIAGSDVGERAMVVRLPKSNVTVTVENKSAESEEPSIDEVFTVRPRLISPKPIPLPEPFSARPPQTSTSAIPPVDPIVQQKLEQVSIEPQKSDPARYAQTEEAVLRRPPSSEEHQQQQPPLHHPAPAHSEARPSLLPLQTNFVPPASQGSPAYGSPYAYPTSLPPGVAMNSVGMPYEIATGRPVYVPPPNVPTMYTPPPMMQHPPPPHFVPDHMRHHSAMSSSEFLPPGTPPNSYMEYAPMGPPLFSFPRQSRVEIRRPDGSRLNSGSVSGPSEQRPNSNSSHSRPTHLRHNAAVFEPSKLGSSAAGTVQLPQEYFPQYDSNMGYDQGGYSHDYSGSGDAQIGTPNEDSQQEQMMGYQPYPQYYYQAYGYNPYLDTSQVGQYEAYPPDTMYYH